jgi:Na+/melibiose symporter-like transporter
MDGTAALITVIVMNLLFAILCSWVATERGRDPVGWFVLGLFLGIIAFIPLAMVPTQERRERQTSATSAARVRQRIRDRERAGRSGTGYRSRRPRGSTGPIAQDSKQRAQNRERLAEIQRNRR